MHPVLAKFEQRENDADLRQKRQVFEPGRGQPRCALAALSGASAKKSVAREITMVPSTT
jgi:hypothetical protein